MSVIKEEEKMFREKKQKPCSAANTIYMIITMEINTIDLTWSNDIIIFRGWRRDMHVGRESYRLSYPTGNEHVMPGRINQ